MNKKESIKSVTFILSGAILQMFNGIGNGWASSLTAIFGMVIFFMGLSKLKSNLDDAGNAGVKLLITGAILSVVGLILDLIPLFGLFAALVLIAGFIVELVGYLKLKGSDYIGESGKSGVSLILIAMILAIVENVIGIVPFVGAVVGSVLSLVAIILVFFGWLKIQEGLIDKFE